MAETVVIAIVDDDALIRASLAGLLRSFGFKTETFASADDLLANDPDRFACVVSDLQMPGTSGLELRRVLLARPRKVPVIIVTAFPERATDQPAGAPVLAKPIDTARLMACIEDVVGRSER